MVFTKKYYGNSITVIIDYCFSDSLFKVYNIISYIVTPMLYVINKSQPFPIYIIEQHCLYLYRY